MPLKVLNQKLAISGSLNSSALTKRDSDDHSNSMMQKKQPKEDALSRSCFVSDGLGIGITDSLMPVILVIPKRNWTEL